MIWSSPVPLSISTTTLASANQSFAYSATLQADSGTTPYSWSVITGALPDGLMLNANTGTISGTPTSQQSATFTVQVQDSTQASATRQFTIVVNPPLPPASVSTVSPNWGTPGTTVTITGSNFGTLQGTSSVAFGGVVASILDWSNGMIHAAVPNGISVSAPLTVTVNGNTTSSVPFYNSSVAPPFVAALQLSGSLVMGSNQSVRGTVTVARAADDPGTNIIPVSFNVGSSYMSWNCVPPAQHVMYGNGCYVPANANSFEVDFYEDYPSDTAYSQTVRAWVDSSTDPGKTGTVNLRVNHPTITISPSVITRGKAKGTITLVAPVRNGESIYMRAETAGVIASPWYVSVPAGSSVGTFDVVPYGGTGRTTVTAFYSDNATAEVTVLAAGDPDRGECKDCKARAGSPINLTNGNAWITGADYSLPGLGGGIHLSRTWNSLWSAGSNVEQVGMFGDSWRSTYEERLHVIDSNTIEYVRADGGSWFFTFRNGAWVLGSPSDEHATLSFDTTTTQYTLTFKDGSTETFNNPGYLIGASDRNGNQSTIILDVSNRITQVTDAAGRSLWFDYPDGNTRLVQTAHDAVGTVATYAYDNSARLTQVTYADSAAVKYVYDSNSLITSVTDGQNKTLETHTYDGSRRGLSSARANGVDALSVNYVSDGTTELTNSRSDVTTYSYELIGGHRRITGISGPGCASCGGRNDGSCGHDLNGNETTAADALGRTTTSIYDPTGNVTSRSVALDPNTTAAWQYTYNGFGQVLTATDPLGNVTSNTYDPQGNLVTVTTPSPDGTVAASTTTFGYDAKGQLTSVTDPLNHATTMTYTAAGLVETVTDGNNKVTTYEYDSRGNRTAAIDALSHRTEFEYDSRSRLKKITYHDQTTTQFGYDLRGRRTSVTDQNGKITTYAYDDADRLLSVTDAASKTTQYAYDTENNLTGITDALSRTTTFAYNTLGRVTSTTFPSTLVESYTYDAIGNLKTKTDRKSQTITYTYDALNRLTRKQYPGGAGVDYTYDLANRLTQVADATGTYGFSYDNMGRLTGTSTAYSFLTGRTFANGYSYDAASNRTGFTDPENGTVSYGYDALNRLTSLNSSLAGQFTFGYDDLSRRTSLARPNGISTAYSYDSLSRLLSVLHQSGGTTVDGATYTVDNAGNRTTKLNWLNSITDTYSYDNIYQLTQVAQNLNGTPTTTESYTFDGVGNRLSSLGLSPYAYNSSNQLTSIPSATFTYDNNGNTLTKVDANGTTEYAWDFENRLTGVTLPDQSVVSFKYDPFGRRIQKSGPSGTVNYVYDGANAIEEVGTLGAVIARYVQGAGIDEPLAQSRSGLSFYQADGLGSITALADSAGTILASYTYDAFGNLTSASGSNGNPYRYTGRDYDSETGLYYYRARYYEPSTGRFMNEDPVRSGMNFFAYVHNNAPNFVDPFGLRDNASPWQVGFEWLSGRGPRVHNFTDGDPFTETLRHHQHIQELINDVCNGTLPGNGRFNYELGGLGGVPKYLRDYSTLFSGGVTGNLAVTYLGSYGLSYSTTNGTLNIHVWNTSSIASATHPPVIGYTDWWNNNIGGPLNNWFLSGPMSATTQYFEFHENLGSRGCRCKH